MTREDFLGRIADLGSPPALAEQVAGLFGASIDERGNPTIHYCELNRRLRKAPLIELAVELRERLLELFTVVGIADPAVMTARRALATALF